MNAVSGLGNGFDHRINNELFNIGKHVQFLANKGSEILLKNIHICNPWIESLVPLYRAADRCFPGPFVYDDNIPCIASPRSDKFGVPWCSCPC